MQNASMAIALDISESVQFLIIQNQLDLITMLKLYVAILYIDIFMVSIRY